MKNIVFITINPSWVKAFVADKDGLLARSGVRVSQVIHVYPSMKWADRLRDVRYRLGVRARINGISWFRQLVSHLAWRLWFEGGTFSSIPSGTSTFNENYRIVRAKTANHPVAIDAVQNGNAQLCVVLGCDVISPETLRKMEIPLLNVHFSDPAFSRGLPPFLWEIIERRNHARMTLHRVSGVLDGGDIVMQKDAPIAWGHNLRETLRRTRELARPVLTELLQAGVTQVLNGEAHYRAVEPGPLRTVPPLGKLLQANKICKQAASHGKK